MSARSRWGVLILAWWSIFVMVFAWQGFAPIIPLVVDDLGAGFGMAGLMVTASMITATIIQVPAGMIGDRYGAVRPLIVATPPLVIATIWTGLVGGYFDLFLARLLIGLGPATFVLAMRSVTERFPAAQMGLATGTLGASVQAGAAFGPLVMPWLAELLGWRVAMMSIALCFLPQLIGWWLVRPVPGGGPRLRWPGEVLADWRVWVLATANVATFGIFLAGVTWLPTHISRSYAIPLTLGGPLVAVALLVGAFARPVGGALADRYGKLPTLFGGLLLSVAGLVLTAVAPSLALGLLGAAIFAFSCGFASGPMIAFVPALFGARSGLVIGIAGAVSTLAAAILPPIIGGLIDLTGSSAAGFLLLSVTTLACALTTLTLRAATPPAQPTTSVGTKLPEHGATTRPK